MKTCALVDGDIVIYKAAAACEEVTNWGEEGQPYLYTRHVDIDQAWQAAERLLERILKAVNADFFVFTLTDHGKSFRKDILPTYKANRSGPKPMGIGPLEDRFYDKYGPVCVAKVPKLEADDVMGIMATTEVSEPVKNVICTIDKDLDTVPGHHYNWDHGESYEITEDEAYYKHMFQTLTGDTTDNYCGIPGIGPKKAAPILDKALEQGVDLWEAVVAAYEKKDLTKDDALIQARVAKILTSDYYQNEEIILWTR